MFREYGAHVRAVLPETDRVGGRAFQFWICVLLGCPLDFDFGYLRLPSTYLVDRISCSRVLDGPVNCVERA